MKKKLIIGMIIVVIILFGYSITSEATILVTNKQVNSEEQFSINVTSDISLISYTITANSDSELTFVNSSGGAGEGTKSISNALTTGSTKQLATFTFKAPKVKKDTQYTITFVASGMGKEDFSKVPNDTKTVTVTVKAPVVQEPEKPITPTPEPETPTTPTPEPTPTPKPETPPVEQKPEFKDTNKTMYAAKDINLRASWSTESTATSIGEGTELTVTATSSNKVNGYVWYRVTYNGKTLYVASNLLTDKKPEKAEEPEQPVEEKPTVEEPQNINQKEDEADLVKDGLQSLQIEGVTLSPTFSPEVYEYRTVVKENISELVINAVPAVGGATVTIAGNTKLAEGENLITIVVYNAEGNVEATYQVTVNKNTLDLSETDNMLKLGTKTARRNLIIFIAILVVALIALIVVMILRRKNQSDEEEFTNNEENVENNQEVGEKVEQELTINEKNVEETVVEEEQVNEEDNQEEAQRPRRDKRKGKHF